VGIRHKINKSFFSRVTEKGALRYLLEQGLSEPIEFIKEDENFVYALCGSDLPIAADEEEYTPEYDRFLFNTSLRAPVVLILLDAGYSTVKALRNASDAELLAISGIGADELRKIRTLST